MNTEQLREHALEKFYFELQDTFVFQMHRIMKAFMRHASVLVQNSGEDLQMDHFPVLMTLDAVKNLSQQEIADILMRDKSSVQRTISLLQRKGLVEISQDVHDKRKNIVNLTEKGLEKSLKSRQILQQIDHSAFADFTIKERGEAMQSIHAIAEKLEKTAAQLPPAPPLNC